MEKPTRFTLSTFPRQLIKWLYPPRCVLCQQPGMNNEPDLNIKPGLNIESGLNNMDICAHCYRHLPWNRVCCVQCALPLASKNAQDVLCGRCLTQPPAYDAIHSLFRYEAAIIAMVHQFKFHQRLLYARLFGTMMAAELKRIIRQTQQKPDCIIPVPLHASRIRQRGFNQSAELAKILSRQLQIPLDTVSVKRVRKTTTQTGLKAKQRRQNIKGAFALQKPLAAEHILLVDDVVTTGSTVNELARLLKRERNRSVYKRLRVDVISIARA